MCIRDSLHATTQAVGGTHGDGTDDAVTQLLLNLKGEVGFNHIIGFGGIQPGRGL